MARKRAKQGKRLKGWQLLKKKEFTEWRRKSGYSVGRIAHAIDVGPSAVFAWARGSRVPSEEAQKKLVQLIRENKALPNLPPATTSKLKAKAKAKAKAIKTLKVGKKTTAAPAQAEPAPVPGPTVSDRRQRATTPAAREGTIQVLLAYIGGRQLTGQPLSPQEVLDTAEGLVRVLS